MRNVPRSILDLLKQFPGQAFLAGGYILHCLDYRGTDLGYYDKTDMDIFVTSKDVAALVEEKWLQDIPALIKEVQADIIREEMDQVKETLWKHFSPQILRGVIKGLPEHYKEKLAQQFTGHE